MDPPRSGRRQTDAEFSRKFCIGACHERRRLFMAYLDEPHLCLPRAKRFDDSIDSVSRKTEHDGDTPVDQPVDQYFGGRAHGSGSFFTHGMFGDQLAEFRAPSAFIGADSTEGMMGRVLLAAFGTTFAYVRA